MNETPMPIAKSDKLAKCYGHDWDKGKVVNHFLVQRCRNCRNRRRTYYRPPDDGRVPNPVRFVPG